MPRCEETHAGRDRAVLNSRTKHSARGCIPIRFLLYGTADSVAWSVVCESPIQASTKRARTEMMTVERHEWRTFALFG